MTELPDSSFLSKLRCARIQKQQKIALSKQQIATPAFAAAVFIRLGTDRARKGLRNRIAGIDILKWSRDRVIPSKFLAWKFLPSKFLLQIWAGGRVRARRRSVAANTYQEVISALVDWLVPVIAKFAAIGKSGNRRNIVQIPLMTQSDRP